MTFREPVSRLASFYLHMKQRGEIKSQTSFVEAISEVDILQDTALYYHHLSRWINIFGLDNVKVIFFEHLVKSPVQFSQILCNKLDIKLEKTTKDLNKKVNSSQSPVNHNLAKLMYSSVNLLHDLGLHKLVDYGKNLGIKRLLFSKKKQKFELNNEEFAAAFKLVKDDVLRLESSLDMDLSNWKQIWQEKEIQLDS